MNYLIITFPNHEVYTYYKLVVDNFSLDASGNCSPGGRNEMVDEMAEIRGFWIGVTGVSLLRAGRPAQQLKLLTRKGWDVGVWSLGV